MSIRIEDVTKKFASNPVLAPLRLNIKDGEILALLGPSGSGKTTLLRMIAGLESCEEGKIFFQNRDVTNLHARNRKVGFVFQHYALFDNMTVRENIAFGLSILPKKQRPKKSFINKKVENLLEMIKLENFGYRYPASLSGGQKQRVALARALATEPEVLLLDEPFGALDALVSKDLRVWLKNLHEDLKFTSIFVTHNQEEAFELADRVAILNEGKIEQLGAPIELFNRPKNRFVFDFLGKVNVFSGKLEQDIFTSDKAYFILPDYKKSCFGDIYFRSHEISATRTKNKNNNLEFVVESVSPVAAEVRLELGSQNFVTAKNWEVTLSHQEQSQLKFKKGDLCYLNARVGHFFEQEAEIPAHIYWSSSFYSI